MKKYLSTTFCILLLALLIIFICNACSNKISIPLTKEAFEASTFNGKHILWQTNAEGDDINIIDIERKRTIKRLTVGDNPHGIAYSKNTNTVYVALEYNGKDHGELVWINADNYTIEKRIEVGTEPHEIEVTPNGDFIYVPCRDGHYWVIDGKTGKLITKINTGGRPHNTRVSEDGTFMFLSPMDKPKKVTIVNTIKNHEVVGEINFSNAVRPSTLTKDGKLFFQHIDGLNGFEVASITDNKIVARVEHKEKLGSIKIHNKLGWLSNHGFQRCHGLEIRPDQKEVWSVCGNLLRVHDITTNDFKEIYSFNLGEKAYWLTFSEDSQYAVIALSNTDEALIINALNKKELYRIKVGKKPKRNLVMTKN